jgi:hypothetical protein
MENQCDYNNEINGFLTLIVRIDGQHRQRRGQTPVREMRVWMMSLRWTTIP